MASRLSVLGIILSLQILQSRIIYGQIPCGSATCGFGSRCVFASQNFACACTDGHVNGQWDSFFTTYTCQDLNECDKGVDLCRTNTRCENIDGGYKCNCVHANQTLWRAPSDEQHCSDSDVNICSTDINVCGNGTRCSGGEGVYACPCASGFENITYNHMSSTYICADINECSRDTHNCGRNAVCENRVGTYTCSCPPSMRPWADPVGKVVCADGDICLSNFHVCGSGTGCGSYGSTSVYNCTCLSGYMGRLKTNVDTITCADRNECEDGTHTCDENAICTNVIGSFTCACKEGYNSTTGPGYVCVDVDECSDESLFSCQANAECYNTLGAYSCRCKAGHTSTSLNGENCEAPKYIAEGIAIAVAIIVVIAVVVLLIAWFTRERCKSKPTEETNKSQDLDSITGRSENTAYAAFMTPSGQLSATSQHGSLSNLTMSSKMNGVAYLKTDNEMYVPNTITNRPVRSRKRLQQARRSHPSSYLSRQSSRSKFSSASQNSADDATASTARETFPDNSDEESIVFGAFRDTYGSGYKKGKASKSGKIKRKPEKIQTVSGLSQLAPEECISIEGNIVTPDAIHGNEVFSMPDAVPSDSAPVNDNDEVFILENDEVEYHHLRKATVLRHDPHRPRSFRSAQMHSRTAVDSNVFDGQIDGSENEPTNGELADKTQETSVDEHSLPDVAL